MTSTSAAIASLTPRGRELMTSVGKHEFTWFDNGIEAGSGIWGEIMAAEMGLPNPKSASGIMGGTKKLGLWDTCDDSDSDMIWWQLTELGAAVANELAQPELTVTTIESKIDEVELAKPLSKTEAYQSVTALRVLLRNVDAALMAGNMGDLVDNLETVEQLASAFRSSALDVGINTVTWVNA